MDSGASAVLQAGKKVILKPGFTAVQGSDFNAKIDPFLTTDATVVTYSYDALGRLISVGTPSDVDFYASYTYHADGRPNAEILVNGAETRNHFYNSPGWLLRIDGDRFTEDITHTTGWNGAAGYYDGRIKTTSFTYNWAGKPGDYALQYSYDNLGQLTSADNNLNNGWDIGIGNTISYDANGNILDLTRGSNTKTYAYYTGTNKVQNIDGSGNDYGYDPNANVISSSPKNINTITYDSFTQRPTSVSTSSGTSLTLEYGGDTQRVLKNYTSGGSTNSRLYLHGQNAYPLIEKNKTSATAETLAVYIHGANGVIAKRVGSTVLFLLKDHLGSTRVVMDATGLVRTYYDYDALGDVIRIGTTNEVKYQFTGQEHDESGLNNYRARLYDSDLGKFYAVDPAEQGWSPFVYAGNNPVVFVDPDGQFFQFIIMGAIIGGYLGAVQASMSDQPWYQGLLKGALVGGVSGLGGAFTGAISGGGIVGGIVGGATGGALSGFGSAHLAGLSGREVLSATWKGGLAGAIGGGIGGYITGPTGAFTGGFASGATGSALNDGKLQDILTSGLLGGVLSLASYETEADRVHRRQSGDPIFDNPENRNAMSEAAQKSFTRGREEGGWFRHNNDPERAPQGQKAQIRLGPKPSDASGVFHTHPNEGGRWIQSHSRRDIALTNRAGVNHFVISRQNIYIQTPMQSPVLFGPTNHFLLTYSHYLWYFGR